MRLNRPVACGDTLATGGHLIVLAGLGQARWNFRASANGGCPADDETSCAVDRDAFLSVVSQHLEQAGIETYGGFGEVCRTSATQWIGLYFQLLDWARADQPQTSLPFGHARLLAVSGVRGPRCVVIEGTSLHANLAVEHASSSMSRRAARTTIYNRAQMAAATMHHLPAQSPRATAVRGTSS